MWKNTQDGIFCNSKKPGTKSKQVPATPEGTYDLIDCRTLHKHELQESLLMKCWGRTSIIHSINNAQEQK
jgi:hypothetical protein